MKIALNMIVKPTDDEAVLLDRCLANVSEYVDGIFLTITGQNKACEDVAQKYNAHVSFYAWDNHFANARNFALAQVPEEYDYWFWLDCDDEVSGIEKLPQIVKDNPSVDAFAFDYLYWFDEWGNPTVVHTKERVFRHDESVEWMGVLHEGFHPHRQLHVSFVEGIKVIHKSTEARAKKNAVRNVTVAENDLQLNPEDPRAFWNLGNSYKATGDLEKSIAYFEQFLAKTQAESEKYIALMRMTEAYMQKSDLLKAHDTVCRAIGLKPMVPDAYMLKGEVLKGLNRLEEACDHVKMSLELKPARHDMLVYNPRDYDLRPLKLLAELYLARSLPQMALVSLKAVQEITPMDKRLAGLITEIEKEAKRSDEVMEFVVEAREWEDEKLKKALDELDPDMQAHPGVCQLRNTRFVRTESSGRDLDIICGYTDRVWTSEAVKEGIGGSEEAVINLSKKFSDAGWNVSVYNNCGATVQELDGVTYKPFWMWNPNDKKDVVILWRHPRWLDTQINADKIFVDMHDVIPAGEYTKKRIANMTKVFFKSQAHRRLFPQIPDEKVVIVPNGIHWETLQGETTRDPYLLINTSSPDRSLETLLDAFERVKAQVPEATLKWAYGWGVWDTVHGGDPQKMEWKTNMEQRMEDMEGVTNLGRIGHSDVAKLYQEATIFAYPTAFYEIDCISARKAQSAGAFPVVTDFAALDETVQHGIKIKTDEEKEHWGKPYQFNFALQDKEAIDAWVEAIVTTLKNPPSEEERRAMREWTKQFDWEHIANTWLKEL